MKKKNLMRIFAAFTLAATMTTAVLFAGCGDDNKPDTTPSGNEQTDGGNNSGGEGTTPGGESTGGEGTTPGGSEGTTPGETVTNAIVPEYKGPAAGPTAGAVTMTKSFLASKDVGVGTNQSWSDGIISVSGEGRDRKDKSNRYTRSVKNGIFTITLPETGKIEIIFSNGSGTAGKSKYQITKDGVAQTPVTLQKGDKELDSCVIEDAAAGTYQFKECNGGTIDVYEVKVTFTSQAAAIKELRILDKGTTDYLVTQKLDCTGLTLAAVDTNDVTHDVKLENCKFDVSKYDPSKSGEYEVGVTYVLDSNLDSADKEFSAKYTVKVYLVDSIRLTTIGLASNKQVTAQQVFLPGSTFASQYVSAIATCKLGTNTIEQKLKDEWLTVTAPDLTAEGVKDVTVSVNTDYTTDNKEVKATYKVAVKAKKNVEENKVTVTVGEEGDFATLTQAVQYLKACGYDSAVNKIIEIQPGTYTEKVWIDSDNVTLVGKGTTADDVKITYSLVEGDADEMSGALWALNCATVHVTGKNFKAYNVAIRNDFDYIANNKKYSGSQAAQGVALTLSNTDGGNVLYKCHLFGNQDTLYMKEGRNYFVETQIDGNIDFIFGGEKSIAFFEKCKIMAIDRENAQSNDPQNGYVTAPQHKDATKPKYGYVFSECELTDDGKVNAGGMALGRPWGPKATVSYINCKFSDAYSKTGSDSSKNTNRWEDMSGATPENADFCEYGSKNAAGESIMTEAVKGGKVLDAATAANYTAENVFGAQNSSVYTTAWDYTAAFTLLKTLAGISE